MILTVPLLYAGVGVCGGGQQSEKSTEAVCFCKQAKQRHHLLYLCFICVCVCMRVCYKSVLLFKESIVVQSVK